MRLPRSLLFILLPLTTPVLGDVQLTTPEAGEVLAGGSTITVSWKESGSKPPLSDYTTYTLSLCMGSNTKPECTVVLGAPNSKMSASVNSVKVMIPAAVAGDGEDVFFIQMDAFATTGGYARHFTPRFTLTSMTGTTPPSILELQKTSATLPPPSSNLNGLTKTPDKDSTLDCDPNAPACVKEKAKTDYPGQEKWKIKFAPMQKQPGHEIKKEGEVKRQWPTSSYSVFKRKNAPTPLASTTYTVGWDYKASITSLENWASPAPREGKGELRKRWEL